MRSDSIFRGAFLVYCLEAGLFLLLSPWLAAWNHAVLLLPFGPPREALLSTWVRSLVSAFGLLHLFWSLHDLDLFLRRDRRDPSHVGYPIENSSSAGDK